MGMFLEILSLFFFSILLIILNYSFFFLRVILLLNMKMVLCYVWLKRVDFIFLRCLPFDVISPDSEDGGREKRAFTASCF